MILLSLSSWGSYEELGGRVKDGTEQKQALARLAEGAWLPSLLLRATPGSRAAPGGSADSLAFLCALWCDAVSVYSIQRYLSFPFVNYI